ncbi:MAG: hypothetical protein LBS92_01735 [Candidatus Methanoplasma sp.]|jgi:hypothetical protein|nr:hypothetical protein [Candidatus Methanoplasma sp.]
MRTLDSVDMRGLIKIYCICGRIVDLDKKEMAVKLSLRKDIECPVCRNMRISRDIDCLDQHFERQDEEESGF